MSLLSSLGRRFASAQARSVAKSATATSLGSRIGKIKAARSEKQIDKVLDQIGEIESSKVLTTAMSQFQRIGQPERAVELFEKSRLPPDTATYNCLISGHGKRGKPELAKDAMRTMMARGIEPDEPSYGGVLMGCSKIGDWEGALEMLEEMRQRHIEPCVSSRNSAMAACGKAGQWQKALDLFDEMRQGGVEPNGGTFNILIDACGAAGELEKMTWLMKRMEEAGFAPTESTYVAAMSAREKSGQWRLVMELLDDTKRKGRKIRLNQRMYELAIAACGDGRRWKQAVALYEEMRNAKIKPSQRCDRVACEASKNLKNWKRALDIADDRLAGEENFVASTYDAAIAFFEASGDLERANTTYARRERVHRLFADVFAAEEHDNFVLDLRKFTSKSVARTAVRVAISENSSFTVQGGDATNIQEMIRAEFPEVQCSANDGDGSLAVVVGGERETEEEIQR